MDVYIEIIYILNSIIIAFSFEILFFLLNCQIDLKKLFQYVLTYNISLVLLYIDVFNGFILLYNLIISIFFFKKQIYIYYPLYTFIYMSVLTFINKLISSSYIFQGILLIEKIEISTLMILSFFLLILIYLYILYCRNKINNSITYVYFDNYTCKALIDSGNLVYYKGYPVIFIKQKYLMNYDIIDKILINSIGGYKLVNIVLLKSIKINEIILHNVYVGIIDEGEYDCILNYQLLGGML